MPSTCPAKEILDLPHDASPDKDAGIPMQRQDRTTVYSEVAEVLDAVRLNHPADGRLTLTSGDPNPAANQTAQTTIHYTPYIGNRIALYDGSARRDIFEFTELSIAVPSTTVTPFDIFIYDAAGTLTLETLDWTNDITRATALAYQDGVLVKSGEPSKRYLGTGRTTGVLGEIEDSESKRFLYNFYNQVIRSLLWSVNGSHAYAVPAWRQWNTDGNAQFEFMLGFWQTFYISIDADIDGDDATSGWVAFGINSIVGGTTPAIRNFNAQYLRCSAVRAYRFSAQYNYVAGLEYGAAGFNSAVCLGFGGPLM